MRQNKASPIAHRVEILPNHARWSGNSNNKMVWIGGRFQRYGDGITWPLTALEDSAQEDLASKPTHLAHRIHTQQELYTPRYQAR